MAEVLNFISLLEHGLQSPGKLWEFFRRVKRASGSFLARVSPQNLSLNMDTWPVLLNVFLGIKGGEDMGRSEVNNEKSWELNSEETDAQM